MSKLFSASLRAAVLARLPPSMSVAAAVATKEIADQSGSGRIRQGAVLTEPAAEPLERPLGVSRHGLVGQPVLEVLRQVVYPLVTRTALERHRFQADRFERRGNRAVKCPRRRKVSLQDPFNDFGDFLARKRNPARQQLVKGRAQAVNVAGGTELVDVAASLFGAHVRRRANRRALLGMSGRAERRTGRIRLELPMSSAGMSSCLADHLGEPPVDDQGLAIRSQHDVGRLQVAVQHLPAVGEIDGVANVEKPPEQQPKLDAPRMVAWASLPSSFLVAAAW